MRSSPRVLAVPFLVVGLVACSTTGALTSAARNKLAKDTGCSADQVQVEQLPEERYRASGCGKTETYVCQVAEHAVVSCVPQSSVQPLGEQGK